jgi:predicted DNA-binding transcriptional regulator AlpA
MDTKQFNEIKSLLLNLDEKVSYLVAEKQKDKLTPKEVQEMLGIGKSTYQRYVKDGVFEQKKIKGKAYVLRSEIEKLKEEGKV